MITAILSLAGLLIGGGAGSIIGGLVETAVMGVLLGGLVGVTGGTLLGLFIAAQDQMELEQQTRELD